MDDRRDTPGVVVGALAAGVAPLPLLMMYSVIFISRGTIVHIDTPDVTNSRTGEALVGLLCLALLVVLIMTMLWFLEARRRWPFVLMQTAALAVSLMFVFDRDWGEPQVPFIMAVAALVSVALSLHPVSWEFMGRTLPIPRRPKPAEADVESASDDARRA